MELIGAQLGLHRITAIKISNRKHRAPMPNIAENVYIEFFHGDDLVFTALAYSGDPVALDISGFVVKVAEDAEVAA